MNKPKDTKVKWERLKTTLVNLNEEKDYHRNYATRITVDAITGSDEICVVFGRTLEESKSRAKLIASVHDLEKQVEEYEKAVKYWFDVLEEVTGKDPRIKPDHVLSKFVELLNQDSK